MKSSDYINKLNDMLAFETRMSLIYRRMAGMLTGPWKDSLSAELMAHSADESSHMDILIRRIVVLGGRVGSAMLEIPTWDGIPAMLNGLCELEAEGIKKWQSIHESLDPSDPFRHVIEDILSTELEHADEAQIWRSGFHSAVKEDVDAVSPAMDSEPQDQAVDQGQVEVDDYVPPPFPVVGDSRTLRAWIMSPDLLSDDSSAGKAWQDEHGDLYGDGIFSKMLSEPRYQAMYRNASVGRDISPLTVLADRICRMPLVRIEWEQADER